jgi:hypothetical protein
VLSRTVVIEPSPGEPKVLTNRRDCLVDLDDIRYSENAMRLAAKRGRESARQTRAAEGAGTTSSDWPTPSTPIAIPPRSAS